MSDNLMDDRDKVVKTKPGTRRRPKVFKEFRLDTKTRTEKFVMNDDLKKHKECCAEEFWLGVRYYMSSMPACVDEREFRRRVQEVFDKAWARGAEIGLADRHGHKISYIAHYAAKCARGVACSIMDDRYKAAMTAAAGKEKKNDEMREKLI